MNDIAASMAAGILLWTSSIAAPAQAAQSTPEDAPMTMPAPEATMPPAPVVPAETMPTPPREPVIIQANPRGSDAPAVARPNPESASTPVPPALPADPGYQAGPYKGALTAPPPEALNKTYPLCTRTRQDSCRNPGGV